MSCTLSPIVPRISSPLARASITPAAMSSATAYHNSGSKSQHVAEGVVFALIKILSSVAKVRDPIGRAIKAVRDSIPHVARDPVRLFDEIHGGFQNRFQ